MTDDPNPINRVKVAAIAFFLLLCFAFGPQRVFMTLRNLAIWSLGGESTPTQNQ